MNAFICDDTGLLRGHLRQLADARGRAEPAHAHAGHGAPDGRDHRQDHAARLLHGRGLRPGHPGQPAPPLGRRDRALQRPARHEPGPGRPSGQGPRRRAPRHPAPRPLQAPQVCSFMLAFMSESKVCNA